MVRQFAQLPPVPRAIAEAVTDAVTAARERDAVALDGAAERLAGLDRERVGLVFGGVVRALLERLHPDGLDSDDVQVVLERCVRGAAGWLPDLDGGVLVTLVAGALGVHHNEAEPAAPSGHATARHAAVLVADLLEVGGWSLDGFLANVFAEIARAETVELP